jgi:hypothetical protein
LRFALHVAASLRRLATMPALAIAAAIGVTFLLGLSAWWVWSTKLVPVTTSEAIYFTVCARPACRNEKQANGGIRLPQSRCMTRRSMLREVITATTNDRNLAADLLQMQQLEIMLTSVSSIVSGAARGPLATPMAAE